MKLYLVQHGEACAKEVDPQRPLTEQGRADAMRMGETLGRAGVRVERVIHSGKLRAEQTAKRLAQAIAAGTPLAVSDSIDPNHDPRAFDWRRATGERDALIVGHMPFMARFVSLLVTGDSERSLVTFQPGAVVCLEQGEDGNWRLNWMLRPELLRGD